ncbi:MAG: TIGR04211 family SH3 domain-containing protein [Deltaproteobacteria bacterium]|jgi:SH3 domain protein|nr:TIGR04211 family SH3 domain-containing protein [Deltaproteobacteria bacterium]MBW2504688.1 TIGR04211 family SH3 domain-containing protein [Deltaproteobacteria bacterium]
MKSYVHIICAQFLVLLILTAATVRAETRYISDRMVVSLRDQPQDNANVVTYLRSDTPIEVLSESGEYVKVETGNGEVGFIKQNYVSDTLPKSLQIERLQKERNALSETIAELERQLSEINTLDDGSQQKLALQLSEVEEEKETLAEALDEVQIALTTVKQEFETFKSDADNVDALIRERDQLLEKVHTLESSSATLEQEQESLLRTGAIKWFLAGAGVLFFGWFIGKLSASRRRPYF